ncbi:MAG: hypothetical protein J0I42_11730 [Bosea sp.]|uniref:hypothetical protein n=1 Tax=Bosea sp. (in: a-proteobacteria) TaxID=1871050 RepID=UPI001AD56848|nr:hypothetical protein [Bosea sp. (in: a-proteobacteria)]MBN9452609.1 hypothetical protein [Bosea sp. (in: a-proteobacteria)]
MIRMSSVFAAARRLSPGAAVLGLALAAGSSSAPAAAAADMMSWQAGCQFKTIPSSAGEAMRYDMCQRLQTCQRMADAGDRSIAQIGCFGFAPEAPVAARRAH